ncbi:MAG: TetR/AcrR family transcriptional regulator [Pseudomonadota bacterium]
MERLSEEDWLKHGLKTLRTTGYVGLKADLMAKSLGVSRGSFYWHFKDLGDFRARLLDYWRAITTERVIEEIEQNNSSAEPLSTLMVRAFRAQSQAGLDQAVRVWAQFDKTVARRLIAVDKMRLDYLAKLLRNRGLKPEDATATARFIYAASLGDRQIPTKSWPKFTASQIKKIAETLAK